MYESLDPAPVSRKSRDVRVTLKRPLTYHTMIVNDERGREKRRRGSELQRAAADVIDLWASAHPEGVEAALREFMADDPMRVLRPYDSPVRSTGQRAPRGPASILRDALLLVPTRDSDCDPRARAGPRSVSRGAMPVRLPCDRALPASLDEIDLPRPDDVLLAEA